MDQISILAAFLAGILSFLSPCVLPLIPGYISFLSGMSLEDLKGGTHRKEALVKASITSIFFVLGFSVVFIALGASATFIGKLFTDYIQVLTKVAGVIIVLLGLYLTGILKIGWLNYQKSIKVKNFTPGIFAAFVIGLAFGFGWTPCVGPILAGILAIAATQETVLRGMILLGVYSLGLGIPFILTGFFVGLFMRILERFKKFVRWIEIIAGIFLIIVGVLIFTNNLQTLLQFVPPVFYEFAK